MQIRRSHNHPLHNSKLSKKKNNLKAGNLQLESRCKRTNRMMRVSLKRGMRKRRKRCLVVNATTRRGRLKQLATMRNKTLYNNQIINVDE
jgi:hypothetical protein